jgi:hypothetical protein
MPQRAAGRFAEPNKYSQTQACQAGASDNSWCAMCQPGARSREELAQFASPQPIPVVPHHLKTANFKLQTLEHLLPRSTPHGRAGCQYPSSTSGVSELVPILGDCVARSSHCPRVRLSLEGCAALEGVAKRRIADSLLAGPRVCSQKAKLGLSYLNARDRAKVTNRVYSCTPAGVYSALCSS